MYGQAYELGRGQGIHAMSFELTLALPRDS
jgi:hypothetical protein